MCSMHLNPDSFEYCVIEVNPRVSRSSALASPRQLVIPLQRLLLRSPLAIHWMRSQMPLLAKPMQALSQCLTTV